MRLRRPCARWTGLLALAAIVCTSPACAGFTSKDGQVLGRTLAFVGDGLSGPVTVGVAYMTGDNASTAEAELVRAVIGDEMVTGRVRLRARLVSIDQLPSMTGVDAIYIPSSLVSKAAAVSRTAERLHIPTLSATLACVDQNTCMVGFVSEPSVQITLARDAAERAGVHFVQAFRMLVREK